MESAKKLKNKVTDLKARHKGTLFDLIDGRFTKVSGNQVLASFKLNSASRQAFGLLHGGVYAYVAESLASFGAWLKVDETTHACVGVEINATHLRAVSKMGSIIKAEANCLRAGKSLEVWSVNFFDSKKQLLSTARCSVYKLALNKSTSKSDTFKVKP